jgi:type IX secretion system PorP/SprF family membrane protein
LQNFNNKFSPNIGAGVYLHSDKAYVGLSIPNFIESNRYNDNEVAIFKKINYYLIAGYILDINNAIKFKPALLTKMVKGAPLQVDLSGNFMFNEKFVLGVAYRWSAAVTEWPIKAINQLICSKNWETPITSMGSSKKQLNGTARYLP